MPQSGPAFNTTLTLNAGDRLDFAVGRGSNNEFSFDSTGISAQIAAASSSPAGPRASNCRLICHPNGRVCIRFSAPRGWAYIIQASTNLMDWQQIGVAVESGEDEFEFEDSQTGQFPRRFYRVVGP